MICQSECACLYQTVNIVFLAIFLTKNNENTYQKRRALMQMYRVVPQKKIANCSQTSVGDTDDGILDFNTEDCMFGSCHSIHVFSKMSY